MTNEEIRKKAWDTPNDADAIERAMRELVSQAYEEAAEVAKRRGKWETASQIRALKDSLVQQSDVDGARH